MLSEIFVFEERFLAVETQLNGMVLFSSRRMNLTGRLGAQCFGSASAPLCLGRGWSLYPTRPKPFFVLRMCAACACRHVLRNSRFSHRSPETLHPNQHLHSMELPCHRQTSRLQPARVFTSRTAVGQRFRMDPNNTLPAWIF